MECQPAKTRPSTSRERAEFMKFSQGRLYLPVPSQITLRETAMKKSFGSDVERIKNEAPPKRTFRSEDLFKNDREIVIVHGESHYRLQITKAGKLILNK